jgi:hypothetical protein
MIRHDLPLTLYPLYQQVEMSLQVANGSFEHPLTNEVIILWRDLFNGQDIE